MLCKQTFWHAKDCLFLFNYLSLSPSRWHISVAWIYKSPTCFRHRKWCSRKCHILEKNIFSFSSSTDLYSFILLYLLALFLHIHTYNTTKLKTKNKFENAILLDRFERTLLSFGSNSSCWCTSNWSTKKRLHISESQWLSGGFISIENRTKTSSWYID